MVKKQSYNNYIINNSWFYKNGQHKYIFLALATYLKEDHCSAIMQLLLQKNISIVMVNFKNINVFN